MGLEIWYLFDASAERMRGGGGRGCWEGVKMGKDRLEEGEGAQEGGKGGERGSNKP